MMRALFSLSLWIFICLTSIQGYAFEGTYHVEGWDPTMQRSYQGEATIRKEGSVYRGIWKDEDGEQFIGSGLVNGNTLSFVFEKKGAMVPGVQLYKKDGEGNLEGPWVYLGDTRVGHENLQRIRP